MENNVYEIKKIFIIALFVKVISAVVSLPFASPWILGFFIPILAMVFYVWAGIYYRDHDELSDEKFADSCYYLGFIFTMVSIIVCLADLPSSGGSLGDLAVRFGAAMVSTVIGLGVRVYLINFKKDITEITQAVEDDILDAAKRLRECMDMSVEHMSEFNVVVDDANRKTVESLQLRLEEVTLKHTEQFVTLFQGIADDNVIAAKEIQSTISHLSETLEKAVGEQVNRMTGSIVSFEDTLDRFTENMNERLEQIQFPEEYFSDKLLEPVEKLVASVNCVSQEIASVVTSVKKIDAGAKKASISLAGAAHIIDEQNGAIKTAQDYVSSLIKIVTVVEDMEKALSSTIDKTNIQSVHAESLSRNIEIQSQNVSTLANNVEKFSIEGLRREKLSDAQRSAHSESLSRKIEIQSQSVSTLANNVEKIAVEGQRREKHSDAKWNVSEAISKEVGQLNSTLNEISERVKLIDTRLLVQNKITPITGHETATIKSVHPTPVSIHPSNFEKSVEQEPLSNIPSPTDSVLPVEITTQHPAEILVESEKTKKNIFSWRR